MYHVLSSFFQSSALLEIVAHDDTLASLMLCSTFARATRLIKANDASMQGTETTSSRLSGEPGLQGRGDVMSPLD